MRVRQPSFRGAFASLLSALLLFSFHARAAAQSARGRDTQAHLLSAREYIWRGWRTLARLNRDLAPVSADPKFAPAEGSRWPVYFSGKEDFAARREVTELGGQPVRAK
jgi:hypothetical protein